MKDHVKEFQELTELAEDVLRLSRNTLLAHLRFLDLALSRLEPQAFPGTTLATDGERLLYDPYYLLFAYRAERERPVRDYLHMVLHCVFRHLYAGGQMDHRCWDLACDIAVEGAIGELELPCAACRRQEEQQKALKELRQAVRPLTAEKLYRYFKDQNLTEPELAKLRQPFLADDHRSWYLPVKGDGGGAPGPGGEAGREGLSQNQRRSSGGRSGQGKGRAHPPRREREEEWKEVSRRMEVDLDTVSRRRGDGAKALVQALRAVNREKTDYAAFLRRYMALGEELRVSDEEFDYIFYTYGLRRYGNMPLVEPLEYAQVRRIREFVIAIDTSGSVSGELVQRFIQKTYNILCQEETFFRKINLHIIQCDAAIQEDRKITSREDLERCLEGMELHGFGGTDFRPVFEYVDRLLAAGEFTDLRGLLYFTDGAGVFPERKPPYEAAFVFLDGEEETRMPPWAIRLTLQSEDI